MAKTTAVNSGIKSEDTPTSHLRREYGLSRDFFLAQPPVVQPFLEAQARTLAEAQDQGQPHVQFTLPDEKETS